MTNGAGSLQTFTVTLPGGKTVTGNVTQPTIQSPEPAPTITTTDGVTVFAGPRDDPFFFDLIGFNRVVAHINDTSVNGGPGVADPTLFTHIDAFAGFNVQALVIEAPITDFVGSTKKFGISAFSYRKVGPKVRADARTITNDGITYQSVDRMGNPAVNTAFITPSLKDTFNTALPKNDAADYASVITATLKKYGTNKTNTGIRASIVFPDTLKLDTSKPDGFPNGRRLQDDVIDTELQLVFNQKLGGGFGDGVKGNDKAVSHEVPVRRGAAYGARGKIIGAKAGSSDKDEPDARQRDGDADPAHLRAQAASIPAICRERSRSDAEGRSPARIPPRTTGRDCRPASPRHGHGRGTARRRRPPRPRSRATDSRRWQSGSRTG